MDRNAGRKPYIHPADDLRRKIRRVLLRRINGNPPLCRHLKELRLRLQAAAEYNTRNRMLHQFSEDIRPLLFCERLHIPVLHIAYDLYSVRVKMIKESCQLERRPVDIRHIDLNVPRLHIRSKILQIHFFNNFT